MQQLKSKHSLAKKAVIEGRDPTECINSVRTHLQFLSCASFLTTALIKKSNILTDRTLHEILNPVDCPVSVPYPAELQRDAHRLYDRWFRGGVNGELLRGIKPFLGTVKKPNHSTVALFYRSYDLEADYPRVSPKFFGEGHLCNGDWWPLQIAAVRDGAHGEPIAGISGLKHQGAHSIVMNMATEKGFVDPMNIDVTYNKYPNFDLPSKDQIWYCGTQGQETQAGQIGKPSAATELLQTSFEKRQPIRVLRGCKVKSKLAPAKGLRYDGLYRIIGSACIYQELAIWIFLLERLPGQTPIRYKGPDVRPHKEELRKWSSLQEMMSAYKSG